MLDLRWRWERYTPDGNWVKTGPVFFSFTDANRWRESDQKHRQDGMLVLVAAGGVKTP